MKHLIVVSGLPRSGTSMMMKMLLAGGVELVYDAARPADNHNPKGYYELQRVKDLRNDSDWLWEHGGRAVKIISHLLPHLPVDLPCMVLLMQRDLHEVMRSQQKMLINSGREYDPSRDAQIMTAFRRHLMETAAWLDKRPHTLWRRLRYTDVINDPFAQAARLAEFLGRPLDMAKAAAQVDPLLYRQRRV